VAQHSVEANADQVDTALAFRSGMRRLASGLCLLTTSTADRRHGMIVTSVCSVSIKPPTLLVCVHNESSVLAALGETFCLNVLGVDHKAIALQFMNVAPREERFALGDWVTSRGGDPMLAGAPAAFDCVVVQRMVYATHTILFGRVDFSVLSPLDQEPLVWRNSAIWPDKSES